MEIGKILPGMDGGKPDVLVLGEVLVELTAPVPLREADTLRISCSGDALNAAAAARAAGASVALVTAVGDDELGERILEFASAQGIDTRYVQRRPEPNGVYFAGAGGEFVYARRGSAAGRGLAAGQRQLRLGKEAGCATREVSYQRRSCSSGLLAHQGRTLR